MFSDELNQDELDKDAANKEMLLDIFYKSKGVLGNVGFSPQYPFLRLWPKHCEPMR